MMPPLARSFRSAFLAALLLAAPAGAAGPCDNKPSAVTSWTHPDVDADLTRGNPAGLDAFRVYAKVGIAAETSVLLPCYLDEWCGVLVGPCPLIKRCPGVHKGVPVQRYFAGGRADLGDLVRVRVIAVRGTVTSKFSPVAPPTTVAQDVVGDGTILYPAECEWVLPASSVSFYGRYQSLQSAWARCPCARTADMGAGFRTGPP